MTLQEATNKIADAAVMAERETGFPAEIIAAQCALESGWLKRAPGNNCFGWKATGTNGQLLKTEEWLDAAGCAFYTNATDGRRLIRVLKHGHPKSCFEVMDWFATFPTLEAGFADHARNLQTIKRYRDVWIAAKAKYPAWGDEALFFLARGIHAAGYATAPNYSDVLIQIMKGKRLRAALQRARLR